MLYRALFGSMWCLIRDTYCNILVEIAILGRTEDQDAVSQDVKCCLSFCRSWATTVRFVRKSPRVACSRPMGSCFRSSPFIGRREAQAGAVTLKSGHNRASGRDEELARLADGGGKAPKQVLLILSGVLGRNF